MFHTMLKAHLISDFINGGQNSEGASASNGELLYIIIYGLYTYVPMKISYVPI